MATNITEKDKTLNEIVGTYYVTCPYCGYRLSARKPTGMDPLYGMTDSEFYKRFGSM